MKRFKRLAIIIPIIQIILLGIVVGFSYVEDMTLSKGKISSFNKGWVLVQSDHQTIPISSLPYTCQSDRNETIVIENTIPKAFYGKTLTFLSADQVLKVSVDGKMIYEFGLNDQRVFGHTPGSVTNFIDIPEHLSKGRIRIEMTSPYENYAGHVNAMSVASRDIVILQLLQNNLPNFACCMTILFSSIVFGILVFIRKISHQGSDGIEYLGGLAVVAFVYYAIETKALSAFFGNQTLYSFLIFMILMLLPMFLLLYYESNIVNMDKRIFKVLLSLVVCNICIQTVLQVTNTIDFMDMAFVSHGLIFLTGIVVLSEFFKMTFHNKQKDVMLEFCALSFLIGGSVIDLIRTYVVKIGDLGLFSRYGMTLFCLVMVIEHIQRLSKNYAKSIEDNAVLLKREVDRQILVVEEKSAQIERLSYQTVMALVTAVDAKDRYTNGHSIRVAQYSRELARRLSLSEQEQQDIYYMALLHDVGKIGIPDEIINKPGRLNKEEYEVIKTHSQIGADILKNISEMPGIEVGAHFHHERYDGKGYPLGLQKEEIPFIARIIAVADSYDAMSSRRSYRDILPQDVVKAEILKNKGRQFDPIVADKMLEMINQDIHYDMREKPE